MVNQLENPLNPYVEFCKEFQTVVLATVSQDANPYGSYAPFIMDESNNIYIFVSDLAAHTKHLKDTGKVSLLFIEDESKTLQMFARKRLIVDCTASLIDRSSDEWEKLADGFEESFGEVVATIRNLGDFNLFKIVPQGILFVKGFGQAFNK